MTLRSHRIVVVGAGPAGVRAAETFARFGVRPIVVDESARDGGQIYRRQPDGFTRDAEALYGSEAEKARALHRTFESLRDRIDYRPSTLAWNATANALHVVRGEAADSIAFDALLICSGATDRLLPLRGWNLAGCYTLGAAQIALKAQACAIGSRVAFAGTGPLLYLVASQYMKAGADVAAVIDTSRATPSLAALRGLLARPSVLIRGMGLVRSLKRAGVRVLQGATPLSIEGSSPDGVRAIVVRDASGGESRIECTAVALGYHLRPEAQLADIAHCAFAFDQTTRQWLPRTDSDGRSSIDGIYLAGDGARVLGADAAEASGRLAALAALKDLGHGDGAHAFDAEAPALRRTLATMLAFRNGLATMFRWPHQQAASIPDDAVVCRCEVITAGELRRATELEAHEINRAKAFSRVGMGRCQGRYCGEAAAEIVAACTNVPIESVGRLRAQAPVRPLSFGTQEAPSGTGR